MDTSLTHPALTALRTMPTRPAPTTLFDPKSGTVSIGRHPEGNDAELALFEPTGAIPTRITGVPGSGTTTLLDTLMAAEAGTDMVTSVLVDLAGPQTATAVPDRAADTTGNAIRLLTELQELVLTRTRALACDPTLGPFRPTAENPLITLTLVRLTLLIDADPKIGHLLESITPFARLAGLSLRAVDTPDAPPSGLLTRYFRGGNLVDLLAGRPGHRRDQVLPGMGLLTPQFGDPHPFRAWPPLPSA
ncbi:hypothetical protein ACIRPK_26475 [Kitasatospora sp. NPDC101801]|uniref:hypothetical protein n=1 Tax=Kitasatospora sp. NPDC101801 TaxID=3364103 RepID=UPI0038135C7A